MARDIDILFVLRSFEVGGAEKQTLMLMRHLRLQGYRCAVFAFQSIGPLQQAAVDSGIPIYNGGIDIKRMLRRPWHLIRATSRLVQICAAKKPRIIQTALPLWTFLAALAGKIADVPTIITCRRSLGTHQDRFPLLGPLDRLAIRMSHSITANSRAVWRDIIHRDGVDASKLILIHNAVDHRRYKQDCEKAEKMRHDLGIPAEDKVAIVVANLIPYKGHADLLPAAKKVLNRLKRVTFLIVGEDRGIQGQLEEMVVQLGISEKVRFLGERQDIPDLLLASHLLVLPSHEEGFSNVLLEAMAAGLPTVATRVGGNEEAVLDGQTGWLVPPRNSDALAAKIIDLLQNSARASQWGKAGRKRIEESFSVDQMVAAYVRLYGAR